MLVILGAVMISFDFPTILLRALGAIHRTKELVGRLSVGLWLVLVPSRFVIKRRLLSFISPC